MKKIYTLVAVIALAFCGSIHAQVNYIFTSVNGTYTPLVSGTIASLSPAFPGTYPAIDEGFDNNVPIGFTFNYNSDNYTAIHLNTNGFAAFGDSLVSHSGFDYEYYKNFLTDGPLRIYIRPILAPLWDDLGLKNISDLTYKTEGSSPNRIFTVEWNNVEWNNGPGRPAAISFQLKLYETTNVIEFIYKQESGSLLSPSASIGITSDKRGAGNFMSLSNTSASPTVSTTAETTTISAKPATGQVYRFSPSPCAIPLKLRFSGFNHNSVTFKWNAANGSAGYEYAVTTSATPPASGINTTLSNATVSSLTANTLYYMHVRNGCTGGTFSNAWQTALFKTAVSPVALPYAESFEGIPDPDLPSNFRAENLSNTSGDAFWQSIEVPEYAATGSKLLYVTAPFITANNWVFTPGFNLTGGASYRLGFKYAVSGGGVHSMEVKYASKTGSDSMVAAPLFSKNNINNDLDMGGKYVDTSVIVTPAVSGIYYFGFHYNTAADVSAGGFLLLDDISLNALSALPVTVLTFSGEVQSKQNVLHWSTATEQNNSGFEVQRSSDGNNFSKLVFINTKAVNGNSSSKLNYDFIDLGYNAATNYYRLKQIDKDGKFSYSTIVVLNNPNPAHTVFSVYPIPAKNLLNVRMTSQGINVVALLITDITGKTVINKVANLSNGESIIQLNVAQLPAGSYFLKIISSDGKANTVQKIQLQ